LADDGRANDRLDGVLLDVLPQTLNHHRYVMSAQI
jgi:hypothetical protein